MLRKSFVEFDGINDCVVTQVIAHPFAFGLQLAQGRFVLGASRSNLCWRAQWTQAPAWEARRIVGGGVERVVVRIRQLAASRVSAHAGRHVPENHGVPSSRMTADAVVFHLVGSGFKTKSMRLDF